MRATLQTGHASPNEALRMRLDAFCALEDAGWASLEPYLARPEQHAAYETIAKGSGVCAESVLVLLSGTACRYRVMPNGHRQMTALILPGDICDFDFLTTMPGLEAVHTLSPAQIARLEVNGLVDACERHPALMRAILRAAAAEAAIARERIVSLGQRTALERVAHLLCEVWHRLDVVGLVENQTSFQFPLTQAELGEALALSTVHVNRTLQVLRRDNVVNIGKGSVTIIEPERLSALAGFEPGYLGLDLGPGAYVRH